LFVLGAARSGTTLLGNYLGSSPHAVNLGEYGGYHFAYNVAPTTLGAIPGQFRDLYLENLGTHARLFAAALAAERGKRWYCDSTPWNLSVVDRIEREVPGSIYVLALRHYAGTVQSLRRSYARGFRWAGATWADSARVWAAAYSTVAQLPEDRTVPVSYEALTSDPETTLSQLGKRVEALGFDCSDLDPEQLTISHAFAFGPRPTIGTVEDGSVSLRPIPSFDPGRWSGDIQKMVWPVVRDVHRDLQHRYSDVYRCPSPPTRLQTHHEIEGLVAFELDGNW
jgi:Sulfotransferase family